MPKFVVTIHLPAVLTAEFMALIPRHRTFINQLLEEHVVETYAISADRTRGWVTMNGQDAAEIRATVEKFPLFRFFEDVEVDELFLFDSAAARFPPISLN